MRTSGRAREEWGKRGREGRGDGRNEEGRRAEREAGGQAW